MKFQLLTIGSTASGYLQQGICDYVDRCKRYTPLEIVPLPDIKGSGKLSEQEQKQREGAAILKYVAPGDLLVLLDEKGKEFTSRGFADFLNKLMNMGNKRTIFLIGGPYGFSQEVYHRADKMISLSQMTFTHEMIRLLFTEQYYRAMTILRGENYHHD